MNHYIIFIYIGSLNHKTKVEIFYWYFLFDFPHATWDQSFPTCYPCFCPFPSFLALSSLRSSFPLSLQLNFGQTIFFTPFI